MFVVDVTSSWVKVGVAGVDIVDTGVDKRADARRLAIPTRDEPALYCGSPESVNTTGLPSNLAPDITLPRTPTRAVTGLVAVPRAVTVLRDVLAVRATVPRDADVVAFRGEDATARDVVFVREDAAVPDATARDADVERLIIVRGVALFCCVVATSSTSVISSAYSTTSS